jgi:hypothetical protein
MKNVMKKFAVLAAAISVAACSSPSNSNLELNDTTSVIDSSALGTDSMGSADTSNIDSVSQTLRTGIGSDSNKATGNR